MGLKGCMRPAFASILSRSSTRLALLCRRVGKHVEELSLAQREPVYQLFLHLQP